jgi:DNA-binding MarR family transcriptional regulator
MSEWSFLTSHGLVLSLISKQPRITGIELSREIGITERAVRRVISDLVNNGYISKKKEGRCIKYRINPNLPMRHDTHQEIVIGDLLEALGWKRRRKSLSKAGNKQAA